LSSEAFAQCAVFRGLAGASTSQATA